MTESTKKVRERAFLTEGTIYLETLRILGEGNGNPLQYSCLEHPMDRGAWWITVHGVTQSQAWLSD